MRTLETLFVRDRRQPAGTEESSRHGFGLLVMKKKTFVRYLDTA